MNVLRLPLPRSVVRGLRARASHVWRIVSDSVVAFRKHRCTHLAAAVAYRALFSVVPLAALLVAVFGWVLRLPDVERMVLERMMTRLPLRENLVTDALRAVADSSGSLTVIGALALVWAGSGLFGTLRDSLNVVWSAGEGRGMLKAKLVDVAALGGLAGLLALSIMATTGLHALHGAAGTFFEAWPALGVTWDLLAWMLPGVVTFAAFAFVYGYMPRDRRGVRAVWPGAAVATVLFEAAKHGFTVYSANFGRYEVLYGALGTVMLFMLWVFVSANILLFGAELAAALERARRPAGAAS